MERKFETRSKRILLGKRERKIFILLYELSESHLNIVYLDPPYPPYTGAKIGMWNRMKALSSLGVKINAYIFKKRNSKAELEPLRNFCNQIYVYEREYALPSFFHYEPFIIRCRRRKNFLKDILQNNFPILFEGVHTTFFVRHLRSINPKRKLFLRAHNIEHSYYSELAKAEKNLFVKFFFSLESLKLKFYEKNIIPYFNGVFYVSSEETEYFKQHSPSKKVFWLPAFVDAGSNSSVISNAPSSEFKILYHANFEVNENKISAEWILEKIIPFSTNMKFIFAGSNMPESLQKKIKSISFTELHINNPDIKNLIHSSDIVLIPSSQKSGVKMKLIQSVAYGARVLCTPAAVSGSELENIVEIFQTADECVKKLRLMQKESDVEKQKRISSFMQTYNPMKNAEMLKEIIFKTGE